MVVLSECNYATTRREWGKSTKGAETLFAVKQRTRLCVGDEQQRGVNSTPPTPQKGSGKQKANIRSQSRMPMQGGPFASYFVVVVVVFFIFVDTKHARSFIRTH